MNISKLTDTVKAFKSQTFKENQVKINRRDITNSAQNDSYVNYENYLLKAK